MNWLRRLFNPSIEDLNRNRRFKLQVKLLTWEQMRLNSTSIDDDGDLWHEYNNNNYQWSGKTWFSSNEESCVPENRIVGVNSYNQRGCQIACYEWLKYKRCGFFDDGSLEYYVIYPWMLDEEFGVRLNGVKIKTIYGEMCVDKNYRTDKIRQHAENPRLIPLYDKPEVKFKPELKVDRKILNELKKINKRAEEKEYDEWLSHQPYDC